MTKTEFINWALLKGWVKDGYGHLQKESKGKQYRFKIQASSVRYEVKIHIGETQYSKGQNEWVRIRSGYLKSLSITPEGKLHGLVK